MHRLTVRLRDEQHRALTETAARLSRTRSDLLREAVDALIARYAPQR
jgi:predicted transcriptional regulator